MSRTIAIFVFLAFLSINVQRGEAFVFSCDQFRFFLNNFFGLFGNRRVMFYLYTSQNGGPQTISCKNGCNLRNTRFDPNLRTTLIVHGFLNNYQADWIQDLKRELFRRQNMNVIVVDWSEIFNVNYYYTARKIVDVARETKKLLQQLARKTYKDLNQWPYIHIIGHSLGAHVAGLIASQLRYDVSVHRVTALDPAKPYFDGEGAHLKLNKGDAQFVDVIHTNSAGGQETFGIHEALGHIDFYPHGGDKQPKCVPGRRRRFLPVLNPLRTLECLSIFFFGMNFISLKTNFLYRLARGDDMVCDHGEATSYFIDTINSYSKYVGKKVWTQPEYANSDCCNGGNCVKMGMDSDQYSNPWYHGVYHVNTKCRS